MNTMTVDQLVGILRDTTIALVKRPGPDLTARQLAVFLVCYLENKPQTVRGLAKGLQISKPAVTRALDRLSEFDLVRRKQDPDDRRSILVQRTMKGNAFLRDVTKILADSAGSAEGQRPRRPSQQADAA